MNPAGWTANHLGHFALTNLLLPRISDRVVTVSSLTRWAGRVSQVGRSPRASDAETANRLWWLSEKLTGIEFPL